MDEPVIKRRISTHRSANRRRYFAQRAREELEQIRRLVQPKKCHKCKQWKEATEFPAILIAGQACPKAYCKKCVAKLAETAPAPVHEVLLSREVIDINAKATSLTDLQNS